MASRKIKTPKELEGKVGVEFLGVGLVKEISGYYQVADVSFNDSPFILPLDKNLAISRGLENGLRVNVFRYQKNGSDHFTYFKREE